ncbi:Pancreatic lipase-related protein 2 [Armadillidium vulgare]|nr:Pancreatic lipase-related protein 2 [Armadillidium vulgare]
MLLDLRENILEEPVERITGLDPASLGFNGLSKESRLDKSDALFVDVIHTHGCYTVLNQFGDCFGTYDNIGHADFWPNGGEYQPACEDDGDGKLTVREGGSCHHGMATVYFTESIKFYKTSTRFMARKCSSYSKFNCGYCDCSSTPQYMGFNANPEVHGVFYLNTSKTRPYGLLEPYCSAGEISIVKILGLVICFHLVVYGVIYSILSFVSIFIRRDLVEEAHVKLKKCLECRIKRNEKSK